MGDTVKITRKVLARVAVLGLCCSAVAQLAILQPPAQASSAPPKAEPGHHLVRPVKVKKPVMQLGAGIDLYTYPNQDWGLATTGELTYLKALNANSVMVSFPFFLSAKGSSTVVSHASTPTPDQLAGFAAAAENAGLYVTLRPLMDQGLIGESRAGWIPRDPKTWFATYQAFLLPYARMAQKDDIPALYVGAEFSRFQHMKNWTYLVRALRKVYKGALLYANNGPGVRRGTAGGVNVSVDAYPDLFVPNTASVARLIRGWKYMDNRLPHHNLLSEVGIAGVKGAFHKPWEHHWPHPVMDGTVQVRWFQAACRAALADRLSGIYFWAIGFGAAELQTTLSPQNQGAWENGPAELAVAACFRHIESLPLSKQ
jgi:hypothetical protein